MLANGTNKSYTARNPEKLVAQAKQIRILSVEDHPVFRRGLATIIETETDMVLVGQAANGVEAIAEFRRLRPDITLMDLRLPSTNGTDILIAIRGEFPNARIIMLSSSDSDGEIQRALRSGASGYVLKSMPAEHLGEEDLTPRELQVLQLIRDGCKNKQVADQLSISENTVNFHIKNLVDKLGANDRTHAVTIAVRRGLMPL